MHLDIGRLTVTTLAPGSAPAEVLAAVDAAVARVAELAEANRELHLELDDDSGRVVVQVRRLDGAVLRTIPPSAALDIISGLNPDAL